MMLNKKNYEKYGSFDFNGGTYQLINQAVCDYDSDYNRTVWSALTTRWELNEDGDYETYEVFWQPTREYLIGEIEEETPDFWNHPINVFESTAMDSEDGHIY